MATQAGGLLEHEALSATATLDDGTILTGEWGLVVADFDGDGWLDILNRKVYASSRLYLSNCGTENWLEISLLRHSGANVFAIGATIVVESEDSVMTRRIK